MTTNRRTPFTKLTSTFLAAVVMASMLAWRLPPEWVLAWGMWIVGGVIVGTLASCVALGLPRFLPDGIRAGWAGGLLLLALIKFVFPFGLVGMDGEFFPSPTGFSASGSAQSVNVENVVLGLTPLPRGEQDSVLPMVWHGEDEAGAVNAASPSAPWRSANFWRPLVSIYLVGLMLVVLIRSRRHLALRRECRALPPADSSVQMLLKRLAAELGVRRIPDLRIGSPAGAPFVLGAFFPILALREEDVSDGRRLKTILVHELAHLRRGDLFVRCLQWFVGAALFFWPVVGWINRRLDLAREQICDKWALRHGSLSSAEYARCLLSIMRDHRARKGPKAGLILATMAFPVSLVERRIEMILSHGSTHTTRRGAGLIATALVASLGALLALSGLTIALDDVKPEAEKKAEVVVQVEAEEGAVSGQKVIMIRQAGPGADGLAPADVIKWVESGEGGRIEILDGSGKAAFLQGAPVVGACAQQSVQARFMGAPFTVDLAAFAELHPTADVNRDGQVAPDERSAFLVAGAMGMPVDVVTQFPFMDRNQDGALTAEEAARSLMAPMMTFHKRIETRNGDGDPQVSEESAAVELGAASDAPKQVIMLRGRADGTFEKAEGEAVTARMVQIRRPVEGDDVVVEASGDVQVSSAIATAPVAMARVLRANPAKWIEENLKVVPTAAETAQYLDVVRQAPLKAILENHPEADLDGNGELSAEEREAFFEQLRAKHGIMIGGTAGFEVKPVEGAPGTFKFVGPNGEATLEGSGTREFEFTDKDGKVHKVKIVTSGDGVLQQEVNVEVAPAPQPPRD